MANWVEISTELAMQWVTLRRGGKAHQVRISKHFTAPRSLCGERTGGSATIDRFAPRCGKCQRIADSENDQAHPTAAEREVEHKKDAGL